MDFADLPPAVAPLRFLLGTWVGEGRGEYPTVDDFVYSEETTFTCPGRPRVEYAQRTWRPPDAAPSHTEVGYLRPAPDGVELLLVTAGGVAEVSRGSVRGNRLELASLTVVTTPTAKSVTEVARTYERRGDVLWYRLEMAAVGQPLGFHCQAELRPA